MLNRKMSELEELMLQFYTKRHTMFDLRCSWTAVGGAISWAVMVPFGNIMVVVPGSVMRTPEASLRMALERWENRSPENPFIHVTGGDSGDVGNEGRAEDDSGAA